MNEQTLPNKKDLEDFVNNLIEAVDELELLLLEESWRVDELEEEIEDIYTELETVNELLKEGPQIIIKEIHHHHTPSWNYYPPIQIQPVPYYGNYPITLCEADNKFLC